MMSARMMLLLLVVYLSSFVLQRAACAAAPKVSQCSWYSYEDGNDSAGYCYLNVGFPLTVPVEPSQYQSKAVTRIYAQNFLCNQHTTSRTCAADKINQCFYQTDPNVCVSQIYNAWNYFQTHTYLEGSPIYFQCPGSKAFDFMKCGSFGIDKKSCLANKKCVFNSTAGPEGLCASAYYSSLSPQKQNLFYEKYQDYSTVVDGDCQGVCMLKQELACPSITSATKCRQAPLCAWNGGFCQGKLFGNDAWANVIYKANNACTAIGSAKVCKALNKNAFTVNTARVQRYKQYPLAGGRAPKSCFTT